MLASSTAAASSEASKSPLAIRLGAVTRFVQRPLAQLWGRRTSRIAELCAPSQPVQSVIPPVSGFGGKIRKQALGAGPPGRAEERSLPASAR